MPSTIKEAYIKGQEILAAAGIHDAAFDARALLSFIMGVPFREIPLRYVDEVTDEQQTRYKALLERRIAGEPLQYITGEQEFMGLPFYVDGRVLIPRLDTEVLAEMAVNYVNRLRHITDHADGQPRQTGSDDRQPSVRADGQPHQTGSGDRQPPVRVLDLCCGSGAIGLSIAVLTHGGNNKSAIGDEADTATDAARIKVGSSNCGSDMTMAECMGSSAADAARLEVMLTDISADALEVARQNAEQLGVSDRISFVQSDLFNDLEQEDFDLIVSNPPYIRTNVIPTLDVEVRGHEPMLALDGGADGLDVYRRIAEEASEYLKPGGCLMMEIGCDQAEDVKKLLEAHFGDVQVVKDLAGLDRVIVAK